MSEGSMMVGPLMTVLFLVGGVIFFLVFWKKRGAALASGTSDAHRYMEQLGYKTLSAEHGFGRGRSESVREHGGLEVRYIFDVANKFGKTELTQDWEVVLNTPSRYQLQIASARITPDGGWLDRVDYGWEQRFPERVSFGEEALDKKLVVYATDAVAARPLLDDPVVRAALHRFPHVDVELDHGRVVFRDPFQWNSQPFMGFAGKIDAEGLVAMHRDTAEVITRAAKLAA